jgi:hypothetical protein
MYAANTPSDPNNAICNPQNHIHYNNNWPQITPITSPPTTFPPILPPPQIQNPQMQPSLLFYHPPILQPPQHTNPNNPTNNNRGQHIQKMTSSSEDDENNIQYNSNSDWQRIRSTKRKRILKHHSPAPNGTTATN